MSTNGIASDGDKPTFDGSEATGGVPIRYASALQTHLNEFENLCKATLDGIEAADDEAKRLRSLSALVERVAELATTVISHGLVGKGMTAPEAAQHAKVLSGDLLRSIVREGSGGGSVGNVIATILRTVKA